MYKVPLSVAVQRFVAVFKVDVEMARKVLGDAQKSFEQGTDLNFAGKPDFAKTQLLPPITRDRLEYPLQP